jgi:solute carrier family 39 (zinc transporter), member 1/2/3
VHSVIIGSSLGVSSGQEFDSLLIAISFHQFFEGIALGTSIVEAQFNNFTKSILLAMVYIVTTPVGIGKPKKKYHLDVIFKL